VHHPAPERNNKRNSNNECAAHMENLDTPSLKGWCKKHKRFLPETRLETDT
jgi:hypothetical protein